MFLEARAPVHAALAFHRDADFSDQELRVIQLLRPHFAMARQNILALEAARDRSLLFAAQFTADFIVIVDGRVREFAGRSSELLWTTFPRDERGVRGLPETVDGWLRSIERSLAHADRPVAPRFGTWQRLSASGRQLVIRPLVDAPEAILLLKRGTPQ